MAKKRRIYQIAKELNISHEEIIEYLNGLDIDVNSHMSPVDNSVYEKILNEFAKEKVIIDRYRKEKERRQIEEERRQKQEEEEEAKKQEAEEKRLQEAREKIEEEERLREQIVEENKRRIQEARKKEKEEEERKRKEEEARKQLEQEEAERKKQKEKQTKKSKKSAKKTAEEEKVDKEPKEEKKKKTTRTVEISDLEGRISRRGKKKKRDDEGKGKKKRGRKKVDKKVEEKVKETLSKIDEKSGGRKRRKKRDSEEEVQETEQSTNTIKVSEYISVDELATQMDVESTEVIAKCMELGLMVTINQRLDMDTIVMVADEFGFNVEEEHEYGEDILEDQDTEEDLENATDRPPVVTIMGHVDHGKTTLLDYIRNTNVVAGESGGITQHIGAYSVVLDDGRQITFLDTPGHEAFTAMRARGAQITDIVILIVAADDGVMPQTAEAINHAKAAGVPIVVAINKIDKPNAEPERVKRELSEHGILIEEWGGKYQAAEISAKAGQNIEALMESILLEADLLELKANADTLARGVVVESELDKGLGPVATILIEKGTLSVGDNFVCGQFAGRVRAMHDERGNDIESAGPAQPVRVLGFDDVPQAGDTFVVLEEEREAKKISSERQRQRREQEFRLSKLTTLDEISKQIKEGKVRELSVVIKGDADGSVEAISDALQQLSTNEVAVSVVHKGVGMISESDVLLAVASDAIIIGFHVSTAPQATALAKRENIEIRNYTVIYDIVDEVRLALEGLLEPEEREKTVGTLEVRDIFSVPRAGTIAGCYVTSGKITRDNRARLVRRGETLFDGEVASLKRFKDDVKEVAEGYECGVGLDGFNDIEPGDTIEAYKIVAVKRTLEQSAEAS